MMPKRVADTDAHEAIDELHRLRPVHLQERRVEARRKHVYVKNPKYKPRAEPARAGRRQGRQGRPGRVASRCPTSRQQVNALIAGEIDLIEQPPHDLLPVLKKDKDISWSKRNPLGLRLHHPLQLPALAVRQPEDPPGRALRDEPGGLLEATIGDPAYYKVCRHLHLRHARTPSRRHGTACW